jgi:hypothetical protein
MAARTFSTSSARESHVPPALGAGGAWGGLAVISSRFLTHISEAHSWVFVGLPVAVVVIALVWRRLPEILGLMASERPPRDRPLFGSS